MTDPSKFGDNPEGWPPPYGGPPPPPGYPPPPAGYPPPANGYGAPPPSYGSPGFGPPSYGYHPVTGEPLSDKSKVIAGLLQLLGVVGLLGIGRLYMGQTTLGVAQLVGGILITVVTCGFGYVVPLVWGIVDTIVLMTGSPRDQYGRLLRDGT